MEHEQQSSEYFKQLQFHSKHTQNPIHTHSHGRPDFTSGYALVTSQAPPGYRFVLQVLVMAKIHE